MARGFTTKLMTTFTASTVQHSTQVILVLAVHFWTLSDPTPSAKLNPLHLVRGSVTTAIYSCHEPKLEPDELIVKPFEAPSRAEWYSRHRINTHTCLPFCEVREYVHN